MRTKPEYIVVDRFEADMAVLVSDDGEPVRVSRALLPKAATPGDVLRVKRDDLGEIQWSRSRVDKKETAERLAEGERLLRRLRRRDPGGDISL